MGKTIEERLDYVCRYAGGCADNGMLVSEWSPHLPQYQDIIATWNIAVDELRIIRDEAMDDGEGGLTVAIGWDQLTQIETIIAKMEGTDV